MTVSDARNTRVVFLSVILLAGLALRLVGALDHHRHCWLDEDSFYAFSIARNLADGKGMTSAGAPAGGYQPASVLLAAPAYLFFSARADWALHSMLVMMAFLSVLTGLFLYGFMRQLGCAMGGIVVFIVWNLHPHLYRYAVGGIGTPLAAFFCVAAMWYYLACIRGDPFFSVTRSVVIGVLLGLAVLSRIEMCLLAVAVVFDMVFLVRRLPLRRRLSRVGATLGVLVLLCSPWFVYNLSVSGCPLPSGVIARRWASLRIGTTSLDRVPNRQVLLSAVAAAKSVMTALVRPAGLFTIRGLGFVFGVALFFLWRPLWRRAGENTFLVTYPVLQLAVCSVWFFCQWVSPADVLFMTVTVTVVWLGIAFQLFVDRFADVRSGVDHVFVLLSAALLLLAPEGFFQRTMSQRYCQGADLREQAQAVVQVVPEDEAVGMFRSGAVEYYARGRRVVNLDGTVNASALAAAGQGRMAAYLRQENVNWLLGRGRILRALLGDGTGKPDAMSEWRVVLILGDMRLYRRAAAPHDQATGESPAVGSGNGV